MLEPPPKVLAQSSYGGNLVISIKIQFRCRNISFYSLLEKSSMVSDNTPMVQLATN